MAKLEYELNKNIELYLIKSQNFREDIALTRKSIIWKLQTGCARIILQLQRRL